MEVPKSGRHVCDGQQRSPCGAGSLAATRLRARLRATITTPQQNRGCTPLRYLLTNKQLGADEDRLRRVFVWVTGNGPGGSSSSASGQQKHRDQDVTGESLPGVGLANSEMELGLNGAMRRRFTARVATETVTNRQLRRTVREVQ